MTGSDASPDHLLVSRIVDLIGRSGGWLPFDDFMHEALYAPGLGYYSRPGRPIGLGLGDGSDFVTGPELSPLFGRAFGRQVAEALRATETQCVFEFGAGTGAMAEQICTALSEQCPDIPWRYCIAEVSGNLRAMQEERLARTFPGRVSWLERLPAGIEGVLIGNEVLDAMPVKLLRFDGSQWQERGVGLSAQAGRAAGGGPAKSAFAWADRPTPLRPSFDHGQWVAGTVTEVHPHAKAWMATLAEHLRRGAVFLVDYGFPDAEYYHPQRIGGTLMCHRQHRADADPLVDVGRKDITAHVNFTGIALAGQDAGLMVLGYTSQARFLFNCGLLSELEAATVTERSNAQRLVLEHEMGELFKVIGFSTPDVCFDAMGFREGDRTHSL